MFLILINLSFAGKYEHFATWEEKPSIYICGKNTQTVKEVKESLQYWQNLGYDFGAIKKQSACPEKILGSIIIKNKYFDAKQGNTYVEKYIYTNIPNKNYLEFAIIELNNEINLYDNENRESLTHEIGHALGIDHVHDRKDIMFPYTK